MRKPKVGDIYKYSGTHDGYWEFAEVVGTSGPSYKINFTHTIGEQGESVFWELHHFRDFTHYRLLESQKVEKILESYENPETS